MREFTPNQIEMDVGILNGLANLLNIKKFSLAGHSSGGMNAIHYALAHPEHVEKIIIFGAPLVITDYEIRLYDRMRDLKVWNRRYRDHNVILFGSPENFTRMWNIFVDSVSIIRDNHKVRKEEIRRKLNKLQMELLIIHGDRDVFVDKQQLEYILENKPNSRIIWIKGGKHSVQDEFPELFNNYVADFLLKKCKL
jgi:pimeloyl-ACP methyl ester carboxylesterase